MSNTNPIHPSNLPVLMGILLWLPFWMGVIMNIPDDWEDLIYGIALIATISFLIHCLNLWYFFKPTLEGFTYTFALDLIPAYNITVSFGLDGLSMCFLLLTAYIIPMCLFSCSNTMGLNYKDFVLLVFLVEIFLTLTFCVTNILFFFIFFESVLIPMFAIIGLWGSRERKINASFYFFLYTLFGSFFLLCGILLTSAAIGSYEYEILLSIWMSPEQQVYVWFFFFIPFAIKIPMYPFHLWLPEAHVEAPTLGSVILASLLLKLGGYGLLRFTIPMLPEGCVQYQDFVFVLALIGVIYGSLCAWCQTDLKRIIAYASIAHMNMVVLGLFSFTQEGIDGAIYLMVGHGIVSAGLFLYVGDLYARYHTRLIRHYSGLVQVMPLFSIFFFAFTLANMSFPGTSNFVGELLILVGLFKHNSWVTILAATGVILSAVYAIWLFNRIFFGTLKNDKEDVEEYADVNRVGFYSFVINTIVMLGLGIYSGWVTDLTSLPVETIVLLYSSQ